MIISRDSIGYLTEADDEYANALKAVERNQLGLAELLSDWRYLAMDAYEAGRGLAETATWGRWLRVLPEARRPNGRVSEEWVRDFGAILIPEILMHVTMVKERFKTPWGAAFICLMEKKILDDSSGVVRWAPRHSGSTR